MTCNFGAEDRHYLCSFPIGIVKCKLNRLNVDQTHTLNFTLPQP